jgi:hypothetical protein
MVDLVTSLVTLFPDVSSFRGDPSKLKNIISPFSGRGRASPAPGPWKIIKDNAVIVQR